MDSLAPSRARDVREPHIDEHFDNRMDNRGDRAVRLVRLTAAPGSGRKAIIAAAVRARQLAVAASWAAPLTFVRGTVDQLGHALGLDDQAQVEAAIDDPPEAHMTLRWVDALLDGAARMAPAVLIIDEEPGEATGDTRRQALLRAALAGHPAFGHGLLLIATTPLEPTAGHAADADSAADADRANDADDAAEADAPPGVMDIAVPPLTAAEVHALAESMVGRDMDPAWTRELTRASGGLPSWWSRRCARPRPGPASMASNRWPWPI
jgi:hypothetical protein